MNTSWIYNPTYAWIFLMTITLSSWFLRHFEGISVAFLLVGLSAFKVAVIGISYMEVQRSKLLFFRFFFSWIAVVSLSFIGVTLLSSPQ